jgi:hypothetical protein
MSFGNKLIAHKQILSIVLACVVVSTGLLVAVHIKASSNCTGPTFDSATKTLSLVCTESTDIHELSCSDPSNPDILSLSVNGTVETLTCPPDVPPNNLPVMNVSGPTTGITGSSYSFAFTGTDPDNDTVTYYVDWNNDGTPDYVSSSLPSGTPVSAAQSWNTVGLKTIKAWVIDSKGGTSPQVSHDINITLAPPVAPAFITASCPAPGNSLSVSWANTPSATSYNYRVDNQSNSWQGTCSPTNSGDYCQDGYGGTSVSLTGIPGSSFNAWVHACNASGCSAPVTVSSPETCVMPPNLSQPNITYQLSGTFSTTTGAYDWIDVTFNTQNNGGSDTKANADYQFRFDRGRDGFEYTTTGSLGLFTVGQTVTKTERVTGNIPFGNARIEVTADNTNAVTETDETDNVRTLDLTIPPPDPGLSLTSDKQRVRQGETATLTWSVATPYPGFTCQLYGPNLTVNPSGNTGTRATAPIQSQSTYTFVCTEPSTNTKFQKTVTVETEGKIEEI